MKANHIAATNYSYDMQLRAIGDMKNLAAAYLELRELVKEYLESHDEVMVHHDRERAYKTDAALREALGEVK